MGKDSNLRQVKTGNLYLGNHSFSSNFEEVMGKIGHQYAVVAVDGSLDSDDFQMLSFVFDYLNEETMINHWHLWHLHSN